MMDIFMGTCLLCSVPMIYCMVRSYQMQTEISINLARVMNFSLLAMVFVVMSYLIPDDGIRLIFHCGYFITNFMLCCCITRFGALVVKKQESDRKKREKIMLFLIVVDIIANGMILIEMQGLDYESREAFHVASNTWSFKAHCLLCAAVVMVFFADILGKARNSASFYQFKYGCLAASTLIPILTTALTYGMDLEFDPLVIGYGVGTVFAYYATFMFSNKVVEKSVTKKMIMEMNDEIILFDEDNVLLFFNLSAKDIFPTLNLNTRLTMQEFVSSYGVCEEGKLTAEFEGYYYPDKKDTLNKYTVRYSVYQEKGKAICRCFQLHNIAELEKMYQKEEYMTSHDTLTGLYNRQTFVKLVAEAVRKNPKEKYDVIISNIRQFKMMNDLFGRDTCDELIRLISEHAKSYLKNDYILARVEGDQFVMFLKRRDNITDALKNYAYKEFVTSNGTLCNVHFYFGVYHVQEGETDGDVMVDRAFLSLKIGDERYSDVRVYDSTIKEKQIREHKFVMQMREAIAQKQFVLYLQPQIESNSERIVGAEALVRWIHPEEGFIPPNDFIPAFEKNGQIGELDYYVWEEACRVLEAWQKRGLNDYYISVNISKRDFYSMDIYEVFSELVDRYEIDVKSLKLEITESAFTIDFERNIAIIDKLRQRGFVIEMDDFGSGYSSLNALKDIPFDVLKLDMRFLSASDAVEKSEKIISMILNLAKEIGVQSIAEGVETREQVDRLKEQRCEIFQGYYYSKPIPVKDFEKEYIIKKD